MLSHPRMKHTNPRPNRFSQFEKLRSFSFHFIERYNPRFSATILHLQTKFFPQIRTFLYNFICIALHITFYQLICSQIATNYVYIVKWIGSPYYVLCGLTWIQIGKYVIGCGRFRCNVVGHDRALLPTPFDIMNSVQFELHWLWGNKCIRVGWLLAKCMHNVWYSSFYDCRAITSFLPCPHVDVDSKRLILMLFCKLHVRNGNGAWQGEAYREKLVSVRFGEREME